MARSSVMNIVGKQAVALAALAGALVTAPAVWAGPPAPFAMNTEIVFPQDGPAFGTFEVQEPDWICPEGTFQTVNELYPPSGGAFAATVIAEYSCDDGSGTFLIQFHPQWNPGTQGSGYWVSGPWSLLPGGTGAYAKLRGSGEMGYVGDESEEDMGEEFFAGLVQMSK